MFLEINIFASILLILLALGILEQFFHLKRLKKIPIRIHVNGTRGKSSVTRLIAAGLREAGLRTVAKTTGSLPRLILPDGNEIPLVRGGRPNVIEQLHVVSSASKHKAEALVTECMALQPYLQWLSEWKFLQATHGVITNVRADHLDVMGPDEIGVEAALAGFIPRNGTLFSSEIQYTSILKQAAQDRNTRFVQVIKEHRATISQKDMDEFTYIEHPENVTLALSVCSQIGVKKEIALAGMKKAAPDPGALTCHEIDFFGRKIMFVNGFAANDPESTKKIWNMILTLYPSYKRKIAFFNCRADRPERSIQLGQHYPTWTPANQVALMGSGTLLFSKAAQKKGLSPSSIVHLTEQRVEEVFESLVELSGDSCLIVGMGNVAGLGLEIVRLFKNRSLLKRNTA